MDQTLSELIFWQAIQLSDPSLRDMHIASACQGDEELRQHILDMVAAHFAVESLLEREASVRESTEEPLGPGHIVGRYELLRTLAEGGMGVVFEARQLVPVRRRVALKVIKPGLDASRVIPRFSLERQTLADMDHPHIAKVLDAGATRSGQPFFVMELVDGLPLNEFCDRHQLNLRQRLELFVPVCQAVQHAHQKGIIHRDLKPSNVLVTIHDGRPLPKVIDFGIAKAMYPAQGDDVPRPEEDIVQAGTPRYMSPEQAALLDREVDTRSDIYSLGVLLFELITGETPLESKQDGRRALLRRLMKEPAELASARLARGDALASKGPVLTKQELYRIRRELDLIIDKCLQKRPADRYESVGELVRDLQSFLADEPVSVCRRRLGYRVEKSIRRHRIAMLIAFALCAILAASSAISLRYAYRTRQAEAELQEKLARERSLLQQNERLLYDSDLRMAGWVWQAGDPLQAAELLKPYGPGETSRHLRDGVWHLLHSFIGRSSVELADVETPLYDLAWAPDGTKAAVAGADGKLRIVAADTWDVERELHCQQGELNGVSFAADGSTVATAGDDGTVRLWSWPALEPLRRLQYGEGLAFQVAYVLDGTLLAVCGSESRIHLFEVASGQPAGQLEGHEGLIEAIALHRDSGQLTSVGQDRTLRIWDVGQRRQLRSYAYAEARLLNVAWSPAGDLLAIGGIDGSLTLLRAETLEVVWQTTFPDAIQSLAFTRDGLGLACGDRGGSIRYWARDESGAFAAAPTRQWFAHPDRIYCLRFSPRSGALLSAAADGRVRAWQMNVTESWHPLPLPSPAQALAAHPQLPHLVTAHTGTIEISDLSQPDGQRVRLPVSVRDASWSAVQFSPRGDLLAAGTTTGRIRIWNWPRRAVTGDLYIGTDTAIDHLAFSPDSRLLAAVSMRGDDQVKVFSVESGQLVRQLPCQQPHNCQFSSDGHLLAVDSQRQVLVYEVADWQLAYTFKGHDMDVPGLDFAPHGHLLATVGGDRSLSLWDAQNGERLRQAVAAPGRLRSVEFSPDGHFLATAGYDPHIRLWRTSTGRLIAELPPHRAWLPELTFSAPAGLLVVRDTEGAVYGLPIREP